MWRKLIDMSFCNSVHPLPNETFPHILVGAKILDLKLVGQYFIFIKIFIDLNLHIKSYASMVFPVFLRTCKPESHNQNSNYKI